MPKVLRIATRTSPLALWQAEEVSRQLKLLHTDLEVELVGMKTKGDKILDTPLAKIGGKGLFVKELEVAMLSGEADIAVHSMKDVPMDFPEGLHLAVIMERHDPRDAFVSNQYESLDQLPENAVVGTSSLRRQTQIMKRFPSFTVKTLRGNVNTRLAKLDAGEYDAIILASSGLKRLGFDDRIKQDIPPELSLPAIGQGALGIECRENDEEVLALIRPLIDTETNYCVTAERAQNKRLNGGCQVPIAGFAQLDGDNLHLRGLIGYADGSEVFYAEHTGHKDEAESIGVKVAEDLIAQGGDKVMASLGVEV